jgi:hypothetical protein
MKSFDIAKAATAFAIVATFAGCSNLAQNGHH